MQSTIHINSYLPSTISTRKVIVDFLKKVNISATKKCVLDFCNISFISRSCADELVKAFNSAKTEMVLENANDNIRAMFNAVIKTQKERRSNYDYVAITHFRSQAELNNFLSTI